MVANIPRLSAVELAAAYAAGTLTPTEVAVRLIAQVERYNPQLNAIVAWDRDAIRAEAAESTKRWLSGTALGELDGVPFVVKDALNVRGLPTSWGSVAFKDYVPERDELPVARMRAAGAIVMGKANVPEFTLRGFTNNQLHGLTRNPWDFGLSPGGSSGGAVAAVAAGFAPLALGTDAGGSIRRPAGLTGLVGLKPSAGRVPRIDSLPAVVAEFDVVGPIARTVADAELCYRLIAAPDLRDRNSYAFGPADAASRGADAAKPLSILLVEQFRNSPVDRDVAASTRRSAEVLKRLGHAVTVGEAPFDTTAFGRSFGPISRVGLALMARDREWKGLVTPEFAESIEGGYKVSGVEYAEALEVLRIFREEVAATFGGFDLVMTPTSATLPWAAEERNPTTINGEPADAGAHSIFTGFANSSGYPGISIPGAPSPSGLPIGLHLVATFGQEDTLLQVAKAFERAQPWQDRSPAPIDFS